MNPININLLLLLSLGLIGCGPINSQFSCNATTKDSCLTIEQVDAMTRFADVPHSMRKHREHVRTKSLLQQGKIVKQNNGQTIWVAQAIKEQSWA
jgi:conjugal transfer pilus assembly protein TraV